jgi:mannose-6-phosphate isomerase-like protein (cupin superfamily)
VTDVRVLQAGEGRSFRMGPDAISVLLEGDATGGEFSILEASLAPGVPGPPPHVHHDGLEEIWYVLDGELDFFVGDRTVRAGRGAFAHVPAGAVHTFSNPGDTPARWLGIFRPATGIAMIEEIADAFPTDGPPDVDRMMATFAKYGVEVVAGPAE